jgi:hypothetical protein
MPMGNSHSPGIHHDFNLLDKLAWDNGQAKVSALQQAGVIQSLRGDGFTLVWSPVFLGHRQHKVLLLHLCQFAHLARSKHTLSVHCASPMNCLPSSVVTRTRRIISDSSHMGASPSFKTGMALFATPRGRSYAIKPTWSGDIEERRRGNGTTSNQPSSLCKWTHSNWLKGTLARLSHAKEHPRHARPPKH